MTPILAVTVGDMNGIGPEVALKAIRRYRGTARPLLVGPRSVFEFYAKRYHLPTRFAPAEGATDLRTFVRQSWKSHRLPVVEIPATESSAIVEPGILSRAAGSVAGHAITHAADLALHRDVDAIVTAPVSKSALHEAGFPWPGQTEMIQHLSRSDRVAMMLVSRALKIGLVTIHLPIKEVASAVTPALVLERILTIEHALRIDWRIKRPTIAVLGLNPHAGEGGELGMEESLVIVPALEDLRRQGKRIDGPFPADGFFARYRPGVYDAVIAMYHDQGLVPLKMLARGSGVNVTVGLPVVRTSPDHGTAFDIAGKNAADASSMLEAIRLAESIVLNRTKGQR